MRKILFLIFGFSLVMFPAFSGERQIAAKWCEKFAGISEFRNSDSTRVDCVIYDPFGGMLAVEVEYNDKIYEAVGQALFYAHKLNLDTGEYVRPAIVFIRRINGKVLNKERFDIARTLSNGEVLINEFLCIDTEGRKETC